MMMRIATVRCADADAEKEGWRPDAAAALLWNQSNATFAVQRNVIECDWMGQIWIQTYQM